MPYRKFIIAFTSILTAAVYFIFVRPDLDSSDHLPFSADTPVEELISQTMAIDEKAVGRLVDRNVILKDVYRSPPLQLNYVFTVVRVTDYFKRSDWRERTEQAIVSSACEEQRISTSTVKVSL